MSVAELERRTNAPHAAAPPVRAAAIQIEPVRRGPAPPVDREIRAARQLIASVDVLTAMNREDSFAAAARVFCEALSDLAQAERVSLGASVPDELRVCAMSHVQRFDPQSALVRDIEAAMNECADQNEPVIEPPPAGAARVTRAARQLAHQHGARGVVAIPFSRGQAVDFVIVIERAAASAADEFELDSWQLAASLCCPRLYDLQRAERSLRERLVDEARGLAATVVGRDHAGAKIALGGVALLLSLLAGVQAPLWAEAPFELQAQSRRVIVAPHDGFLQDAGRRSGDLVSADQDVLARLRTDELELEAARARAERGEHLKQAAVHQRDGRGAEAQLEQTRAEQAGARLALLEHRIRASEIRSPIDGVIVGGDLSAKRGARVSTGDVLFEVAQPDALLVRIQVPESDAPEVAPGQRGELAAAALPGKKLGFVVQSVEPAARVEGQANVFVVRAALDEAPQWLRPGMRGVARIEVGRASYLYSWTRRGLNWLRMQWWM